MIFNITKENNPILISPLDVFFTQEQRSKISISLELTTNEYAQEDLLGDILISIDKLGSAPFDIPENIAYMLSIDYIMASIIDGDLTGFTITYDGVDYVYNSTNILIIQDDEEPSAPTLYSAVFNSETGVTTSEYTLGDNLVVSDENNGTSLSPALLLLTSELAQNMSVSVATTNNSSSSVSSEIILNIVDSMSVKEIANFADIDISSISSFISEHNITHVVSFMGIYNCFAPSTQGTQDEVISSFTITYNGNSYTYGFDNFTFNVG